MRRLTLVTAGLLACLASACAGPPPALGTPPPAAAASTADVVTQALVVAELAYQAAGTTVLQASRAGLVRPGTPLAARLLELNEDAQRALGAARSAQEGTQKAAAAARALGAVTRLSRAAAALGGQ